TVAPATFFDSNRKIIPGPGVIRGKTYFENEWTFWLYPSGDGATASFIPASESRVGPECPLSSSPEVLLTRSWDEAEKRLATGGRVLLVPGSSDLDWTCPTL